MKEWEKDRLEFVYATWAQHAIAAAQASAQKNMPGNPGSPAQ